jgi:5'-nucleotidase
MAEKLKGRDGRPYLILVTNDDGIYAPGLVLLEKIARELSSEVWVVAPETEQSGASHSLSLAFPLRLRQLEERRVAIQGTPSDCVLMASRFILPQEPDLILSGINRGQNLAEDVTYSGTIAAAMEGAALGLKSIALSQVLGVHSEAEAGSARWDVPERHAAELLRRLIALDLGPGVLLNVNFPDCAPEEVTGVEVTRQGKRDQNLIRLEERTDLRGRRYFWIGFRRERSNPAAGTDLRAVYEKRISVTPLHMNMTQLEAIEPLRLALETE